MKFIQHIPQEKNLTSYCRTCINNAWNVVLNSCISSYHSIFIDGREETILQNFVVWASTLWKRCSYLASFETLICKAAIFLPAWKLKTMLCLFQHMFLRSYFTQDPAVNFVIQHPLLNKPGRTYLSGAEIRKYNPYLINAIRRHFSQGIKRVSILEKTCCVAVFLHVTPVL